MFELYGANASPYSRKLRAIMRYRRIPHTWHLPKMNTTAKARISQFWTPG